MDLFSALNNASVIAALREEAATVLREHNGIWTKQAVSKLYRLDSVIRESTRMSGIGGTSMARKVKVPGGMTLPDGTWVPENNTIGVSMDGIHFDEEIYENPLVFDPFRFSRPREMHKPGDKPLVNEDFVTTSTSFLPWTPWMVRLFFLSLRLGDPRANVSLFVLSPGRFFAANNLKIMFAHLLLNYEVEPFETRPPNISIDVISVVPMTAKMRIRRRVGEKV